MRERPILFSAPMVRAILSGEKTQTRRTVRPQPDVARPGDISTGTAFAARSTSDDKHLGRLGAVIQCPHGQPGDRLWVREAWQHANHPDGPYRSGVTVHYRADYIDDPHGPGGEKSPEGRYRTWRPSIHMPRAASRITLEITGVRVERLRDISEADALAEGLTPTPGGWWSGAEGQAAPTPQGAYALLWDSINGPGSWGANPWVWVIEFRRI